MHDAAFPIRVEVDNYHMENIPRCGLAAPPIADVHISKWFFSIGFHAVIKSTALLTFNVILLPDSAFIPSRYRFNEWKWRCYRFVDEVKHFVLLMKFVSSRLHICVLPEYI